MQTECEVMQSEAILGSVIKELNLDQEWGRHYGSGQALNAAETMTLLKSRMTVRPLRTTSLISISIYADQPEEAARIANEIVKAYKDRDNLGPFQVEVVDQAMPATSPIRPNKPLNLALGALFGLVLGAGAGAARVALHARKNYG